MVTLLERARTSKRGSSTRFRLTAVSLQRGKLQWRSPLYGGRLRTLLQTHTRIVIAVSQPTSAIIGLDAKTGKVQWRHSLK